MVLYIIYTHGFPHFEANQNTAPKIKNKVNFTAITKLQAQMR